MSQTISLTIPELWEQVNAGKIPLNAAIEVTLPNKREDDPTLALFEQWDEEDARQSSEAQAENERIYSSIEQNGIHRIQI